MPTVYLLLVWLHILAAAIWIGGMVALGAVLVPVLRNDSSEDSRALLYRSLLRFRWVGWGTLVLLIGTGILLLGHRGYDWAALWTGRLWAGSWGHLLAEKLGLVAVTLVVSGVHDFVLGPRAVDAMQSAPEAPRTERLRWWSSWLGRLTLVLSLAVLWWATMLVRGAP